MKTIGYIGLGLMGKPIATNLLKAGFPVVIHNRSRRPVDDLINLGAYAAGSPAEVAARVDIVFTNLPDSPDVEKVALGPNGIIEGAHNGLIFVDNSTIKPASARSIAIHLAPLNVACLDAPVSGGDIGARNATLTIMVGGPEQHFLRYYQYSMPLEKRSRYIGPSGIRPNCQSRQPDHGGSSNGCHG